MNLKNHEEFFRKEVLIFEGYYDKNNCKSGL